MIDITKEQIYFYISLSPRDISGMNSYVIEEIIQRLAHKCLELYEDE